MFKLFSKSEKKHNKPDWSILNRGEEFKTIK